jgi:hypothetical protein
MHSRSMRNAVPEPLLVLLANASVTVPRKSANTELGLVRNRTEHSLLLVQASVNLARAFKYLCEAPRCISLPGTLEATN